MAKKMKISQMPEKTQLTGSEYIPIVDGSSNKKVKTDKLLTKTEAEEDYQEKLVSSTNIKTVNGESVLGNGNIEIAVPDTSDMLTKTEAADLYQSKGDYALKSEIPDTSTLLTKTEASETYQAKGDYLTQTDLENYTTDEELSTLLADYATKDEIPTVPTKVSELENDANYISQIKTINGQSLIGEGNIEVSGGGESGLISDAPADNKLYGRKNNNWEEVIVPDLNTINLTKKSTAVYELQVGDRIAGSVDISSVGMYYPGVKVDTQKLFALTKGSTEDKIKEALQLETSSGSYTLPTAEILDTCIGKGYQLLSNWMPVSVAWNGAGYVLYIIGQNYLNKPNGLYTVTIKITDGVYSVFQAAKFVEFASKDYVDATKTELGNKLDTSVYESEKANFATKEELNQKQDQLVSGTNIKTINGKDILGEGNLEIEVNDESYNINLTDLLATEESDAISTAIGGIDNLRATVGNNKIIVGTINNGSVSVSIRILGQDTTLYYILDTLAGYTVNEITITNTDGTLTKSVKSHSMMTEEMVVDNLATAESTLPLSANQGKILNETKLDTETYNSDKGTFATKTELNSKLDVETYNQDKASFITEIPEEYITETELTEKGYATSTELATKLDTDTYNADKATFALKEEIPTTLPNPNALTVKVNNTESAVYDGTEAKEVNVDLSPYLTSETAQETYQPKGNYATLAQVQAKQDQLVSGTNIKTVNGASLLGEGDIIISGSDSDLTDAPIDGTYYCRKDGSWVPVPSSGIVDGGTYTTEPTTLMNTFALKSAIPTKVSELENDSIYVTDEELEEKMKTKVTGIGLSAIQVVEELPEIQEAGVLYLVVGKE